MSYSSEWTGHVTSADHDTIHLVSLEYRLCKEVSPVLSHGLDAVILTLIPVQELEKAILQKHSDCYCHRLNESITR